MRDPHGVLVGQGPNSQHPDCFRFDDVGQVVAAEAIIREYLAEAMGYAEEGIRPPKVERVFFSFFRSGVPVKPR